MGPKDVEFRVDLVEACLKLLRLLAAIDEKRPLVHQVVIMNAIRRYEVCWLPLAAELSDRELVPPLDIHMVWLAHMIELHDYQADCQKLVGKVIPHRLLSETRQAALREVTRRFWADRYPREPYSPDLDALHTETVAAATSYRPRSGADLLAAVTRQTPFYYQVSLPHYRDNTFLQHAVHRYRKYLRLQRFRRGSRLVPCCDVDLVLRAHRVHPVELERDMAGVFGYSEFSDEADPGPDDTGTGGRTEADTRELWRATYGEEYHLPGTQSRGAPPSAEGRVTHVSDDDMDICFNKKAQVILRRVHVGGTRHLSAPRLRVSLWNRAATKSRAVMETGRPAKDTERWNTAPEDFYVDTNEDSRLVFELCERRGGRLSKLTVLGASNFNLSRLIISAPPVGKTDTWSTELKEEEHQVTHKLTFDLSVTMCARRTGKLLLLTGPYQPCVMLDRPEDTLGPVPVTWTADGGPNTCTVGTHRLVNQDFQHALTCVVIHSVPMMTSVIQIRHRNVLTSLAHTVDATQLPSLKQVKSKQVPVLDASDGERAILIKDEAGDWGICFGKWVARKRESSRLKRPSSSGHLRVKFHSLRAHRTHVGCVRSTEGDRGGALFLGDVWVDLPSGAISIRQGTKQVAQNVCLAVAVGVLYVLLEPRPVDAEGATLRPNSRTDGMALVAACGYRVGTPCNSFITAAGTMSMRSEVSRRSSGAPKRERGSMPGPDGSEATATNSTQGSDEDGSSSFHGEGPMSQGFARHSVLRFKGNRSANMESQFRRQGDDTLSEASEEEEEQTGGIGGFFFVTPDGNTVEA